MPHLACESRDYRVGNGSLTGNNSGRTIDENHYPMRRVDITILPTIFYNNGDASLLLMAELRVLILNTNV